MPGCARKLLFSSLLSAQIFGSMKIAKNRGTKDSWYYYKILTLNMREKNASYLNARMDFFPVLQYSNFI
jgi:hypothetical protein